MYPRHEKRTKNPAEMTENGYKIEILMSWTQKLKGLATASLRLKTLNDNPYFKFKSMQIYLRPITEADGPNIVRWRNNPSVLRHCLDKTHITEESNRAFYKANIETGKYKQFIVECVESYSGVCTYPIATVYLKDMDYGNKRCELCIFTSSDVEWNSEGQTIAIEMLVEKAFKDYGMHKVYTYVFSKFPDEIDLLSNAGFKIEALLKEEAVSTDGLFEDIVRLSVLNVGEK